MLQNLLRDRFRLVTYTEMQEQPIYALVLARSDQRLGPRLVPSQTDCGSQQVQSKCVMGGRFTGSGGDLKGLGQPLSALATQLRTATDRIVIDRTGLTGRFDFEFAWSTGDLGADAPTIFTALTERLGLKLEPARGPVEVLVIDSVERPTPGNEGLAGVGADQYFRNNKLIVGVG
jgi:bla regulator protein BlaR1